MATSALITGVRFHLSRVVGAFFDRCFDFRRCRIPFYVRVSSSAVVIIRYVDVSEVSPENRAIYTTIFGARYRVDGAVGQRLGIHPVATASIDIDSIRPCGKEGVLPLYVGD